MEPGKDQLRVSNIAPKVFEMNIRGPRAAQKIPTKQTGCRVKFVKVPPGLVCCAAPT